MATTRDPSEIVRRTLSGDLPNTVNRTAGGAQPAAAGGGARMIPPGDPAAAQLQQITPQEVERNLNRARIAENRLNAQAAFGQQPLAQQTAQMRAGGMPPPAASAAPAPAAAPAAQPGARARVGRALGPASLAAAAVPEAGNVYAAFKEGGAGEGAAQAAESGTRLGSAALAMRAVPHPVGKVVAGTLGYAFPGALEALSRDVGPAQAADRAAGAPPNQYAITGNAARPTEFMAPSEVARQMRWIGPAEGARQTPAAQLASVPAGSPEVLTGRAGGAGAAVNDGRDFYPYQGRSPTGGFSSPNAAATLGGRSVSTAELADAGRRLQTAPTGSTAPGVAYSMATGGDTLPLAPARGGGTSFNTRAAFEVAAAQRARGDNLERFGSAASRNRLTTQDLASSAADAIRSGRRRTARAYTDLMREMGAAEGRSNTDRSSGTPAFSSPAQDALAAAEAQQQTAAATTASVAAQQAQRVAELQQQIMAESDPGRRAELASTLAAVTGTGQRQSLARQMLIDVPVQTPQGETTLKLPYDPNTQQLIWPEGMADVLGQNRQPQTQQ